MSPGHSWFEEPDDKSDDEEFPEDSDFGDEEPNTIRCPECGAEVYDDAVQCPTCGSYLPADTSPWSGRSLWWIVLGLLGAGAAIAALVGLTRW
jgi:DNA-directed RNA polymerase subunit RPC12/RpoP